MHGLDHAHILRHSAGLRWRRGGSDALRNKNSSHTQGQEQGCCALHGGGVAGRQGAPSATVTPRAEEAAQSPGGRLMRPGKGKGWGGVAKGVAKLLGAPAWLLDTMHFLIAPLLWMAARGAAAAAPLSGWLIRIKKEKAFTIKVGTAPSSGRRPRGWCSTLQPPSRHTASLRCCRAGLVHSCGHCSAPAAGLQWRRPPPQRTARGCGASSRWRPPLPPPPSDHLSVMAAAPRLSAARAGPAQILLCAAARIGQRRGAARVL